MLQKASV